MFFNSVSSFEWIGFVDPLARRYAAAVAIELVFATFFISVLFYSMFMFYFGLFRRFACSIKRLVPIMLIFAKTHVRALFFESCYCCYYCCFIRQVPALFKIGQRKVRTLGTLGCQSKHCCARRFLAPTKVDFSKSKGTVPRDGCTPGPRSPPRQKGTRQPQPRIRRCHVSHWHVLPAWT